MIGAHLYFKSLQKIFICPNCNLVSGYDEEEPLICPKCRKPAEDRIFVRIKDLSGGLSGKRLLLKGIILGEGETKTIPVSVNAKCDICNCIMELNLKAPEYKPALEKLFFIKKEKINNVLSDVLPRGPCKTSEGHKWQFEVKEWLDFREARIQDLIEFEEAQEREPETRSVTAILLDKGDVKVGLFDSEILIAPDNRIMLLIHRVAPLEFTEDELKREEIEKVKMVFQGKSLSELEPIIDRVVAPEVRGRVKAKVAAVLTALSPRWFNVIGERNVPGCMRTLFFGDPRTGKGMILRWFWYMGIAGHVVGETAARTGLIYSIDPELKTLSWGVLPQNDGRMVSIEGLHGLLSEEIERFREALAQQRVEVHRVVKGAAWCRTRILADLNPNQPSLSNYPYVCRALLDSRPFYQPIDLTRWDLFIPFKREDVSVEEMYGEIPEAEEREKDAFLALVKWAWSRRTIDIKITEEAFEEAKSQFKRFLEEYGCEEFPVVHNASLWTLLRLSIALAALEFSSPNNEQLIVEKKHVEEASAFWRWSLDQIELAEAKMAFEEKPLTESEIDEIKTAFKENEELQTLFLEIVNKPGDVAELAGRLGVSEKTVKRRAAELKRLELIQRGRRGYYATKKGIQYFRLMRETVPSVPFVPSFSEAEKISGKNFEEVEERGQKGQLGQFLKEEKTCEVCGKPAKITIMRAGSIHYFCSNECAGKWTGPL